jgi:hypothetical protein
MSQILVFITIIANNNLLTSILGVVSFALFAFIWYKSSAFVLRYLRNGFSKNRHAYDVEILVSKESLEVVGGVKLRVNDIHRLQLINAIDQSYSFQMNNVVAVGSPGMAAAAVGSAVILNSVAAYANHTAKKNSEVSYILTAEAGGKSHRLAGGLNEICARGLITDIGNKLGIS